MKYGILVIALICVLFAAGCASQPAQPAGVSPTPAAAAQASSQAVAQAPASSGPSATVIIEDKAFNPTRLTVTAGTTVVWMNQDTVSHRVVHLPPAGTTELFHSDRIDPGQSFSFKFTTPGTYGYNDPQYAGGTGFNPTITVQ